MRSDTSAVMDLRKYGKQAFPPKENRERKGLKRHSQPPQAA